METHDDQHTIISWNKGLRSVRYSSLREVEHFLSLYIGMKPLDYIRVDLSYLMHYLDFCSPSDRVTFINWTMDDLKYQRVECETLDGLFSHYLEYWTSSK